MDEYHMGETSGERADRIASDIRRIAAREVNICLNYHPDSEMGATLVGIVEKIMDRARFEAECRLEVKSIIDSALSQHTEQR